MRTRIAVLFFLFLVFFAATLSAQAEPLNTAGGDDVVVDRIGSTMSPSDVVITANGNLFTAVGWSTPVPDASGVTIYRSTDGGTQWAMWGEFESLGSEFTHYRKMILAEGDADRLIVLYTFALGSGDRELRVATADPGAASAVWSYSVVMDEVGVDIRQGDICSDAESFSGYYLYVVAEGSDGNGNDIWFSRSTDFGLNWSAPYVIAEQFPDPDYNYMNPQIAYGSGNRVHVAWSYGDHCDGFGCFDNALRYRYALNDAINGIADWQPVKNLTSLGNGEDNNPQEMVASQFSDHVILLYNTRGFELDVKMWYSTDGGATWPASQTDYIDAQDDRDIRIRTAVFNSAQDKLWISGRMDGELGGCDTRAMVLGSPLADPLDFDDVVCLSGPSEAQQIGPPGLVAHPSSATDYALVWSHINWVCAEVLPYQVQFDATWQDGPGYPNLEPGFPVDLTSIPASPPALVDLGAGPELEIVFSDWGGYVQVLDHTGAPFAAWPQSVGNATREAPVAVGDLNSSGEMVVVAGTQDGHVWAFDAQGAQMPGFPVDLGTGADTYVSIGPVAPPYPRSIVACSGNQVFVINRSGRLIGYSWTLDEPIEHQATLGDVTGDDLPEIIVAAGNRLVVIDPADPGLVMNESVTTHAISDAPVVADLEPDGLREILVSTVNGFLHCYHWDGTNTWSFDSGGGDYLGGPAVANILGSGELEILVANFNAMHLILDDGSEHSSYPEYLPPTGDYFVGTPILDGIHNPSPAIVNLTGLGDAWAYQNTSGVIPGWPKSTGEFHFPTPASGDIDNDGNNEVVVLTEQTLVVWDVNSSPEATANSRWPMDSHDPGRTGCLDCVQYLVSDVGEMAGVTRLSFAPPNPNPANGPMSFSFALPADAGVQLEVFDIRGRRVKMVKRTNMARGNHIVQFDGRDNAGRNLASGMYYARLSVRGPGIDRTLARKFTVLR